MKQRTDDRKTGRSKTSGQRKAERRLNFEPLENRAMLSADPLSNITAQTEITPLASGGGPVGYTPAQITSAYGFNNVNLSGGNGAGQTIAIVDAYDDPNIASDLATFDAQFNLPAANFTKIEQTVGGRAPAEDAGWAAEISLDVEWAHAIAPDANIELIEANNSSLSDLLASVQYAASQPGVSVVSMSWGTSEFNGETSYNSYFTTPSGHTGVSFVASAGDNGAGALWPAISPNVLSVGGTSLNLSGSSYSSETAWSGSGGGKSAYQGESSYQEGVQTSGAAEDPDVAYDANPNTGLAVYDSISDDGYVGWEEIGGTSVGAPSWSALVAIADQGRVAAKESTLTSAAAAIYSLPSSDFHDVTSGSNGGYSATKGYDEVTGLGSPVANQVIQGLIGTTTAQQTFTTSTLTTTTHRGGFSFGGGGQRRFDDVGDDESTSLLITGATFNSAAGNSAAGNSAAGSSLGASSVASLGSQSAAGPSIAASNLTTSLLASGTIQQVPGSAASSMLSTTDIESTSADGAWTDTPAATGAATAGLALADRSETADRSVHDRLASNPRADATAQSLVESLDALFSSGADWADRHAALDAGAWAAASIAAGAGANRAMAGQNASGQAERPTAAVLAVGVALSALWPRSERADEARRQPRTLTSRRHQ